MSVFVSWWEGETGKEVGVAVGRAFAVLEGVSEKMEKGEDHR